LEGSKTPEGVLRFDRQQSRIEKAFAIEENFFSKKFPQEKSFKKGFLK
jgi:hypothetical protein